MGFCAQTGLTSLSIAQRLGYISVVELLKNITEVAMSPLTMEEKYKVLAPEIMQEAAMSDSEEEGGTYYFLSLFYVTVVISLERWRSVLSCTPT